MKTFEISSKLISIEGLDPLKNGRKISAINVVLLSIMSIILIASVYDVLHVEHFLDITDYLVALTAANNCMGKYVAFIINRYTLHEFRESVQQHVAEAINSNREKYYERANQVTLRTFQIYFSMSLMSMVGVNAPREWVSGAQNFIMGTTQVEPVVREYPLGVTLFDHGKEYPSYPYYFGIVALSVSLLTMSHTAADVFFFETCFQLRAILTDFQDLVARINTIKVSELNKHLKLVVQLHCRSFMHLDMFQAITSGQIFFMYINMSLIAVAAVFQLDNAFRAGGDEFKETLTKTWTVPMTVLFSLFIYCYMADEVSHQNSLVADVTYQTEWYKLSPKKRRFLILIMARAQPTVEFSGFKFIVCNLRGYLTTIRLIGSAVTLFHGLSTLEH